MRGDFSRSTFDRSKSRTSVRMQQGRVLLDADWNEQVDLQEYLRREAFRDVVGTSGVPASQPDSFAVIASGSTLEIKPGRIWVDGLLVERTATEVQLDSAELAKMAEPGNYAIVLEAWERHITAVEDPSIRETALGGPDTATRTTVASRLRVVPVDVSRCQDLGELDLGNTTGTLAARTQPPVTADDPCVVPAQAGYTGIENHLYRIEIHQGGSTNGPGPKPTFKWSRDNGSILSAWRQRSADQLTIESLGRDTVGGFHGVQWVELGHDDFDLREQPGPLVRILQAQVADDGESGLLTVHPADLNVVPVLPDPDYARLHAKVRRWDSGPIALEPGVWQDLGEHHLQVQFAAGTYRTGDFWWIPARAFLGNFLGDLEWPRVGSTPSSLPPHGVKRVRARLAIVRKEIIAQAGVTTQRFTRLDDCRCIFNPLCRVEAQGCCTTIHVSRNRGDVRTIAEAFAALPPEGGEICIGEGVWNEALTLTTGHVVIRGCGERTRWVAPAKQPALTLEASSVTVRDLTFVAPNAAAIQVGKARRIGLHHLNIEARHRCAVVALRVEDLEISDCDIRYFDPIVADLVNEPAVFVGGEKLRLYRNRVTVAEVSLTANPPAENDDDQSTDSTLIFWRQSFRLQRPGLAPGTVQIAGRSRDVELRENVIEGGSWHGVALGSTGRAAGIPDFRFDQWKVDPATGAATGPGFQQLRAYFDRGITGPRPFPLRGEGTTRFLDAEPENTAIGRLFSDGDLQNVRLIDNQILKMGGSGISADYFFAISGNPGVKDLIGVDDLLVQGNTVRGCLRNLPWRDVFSNSPAMAFGSLALSQVSRLVVRNNVFENNGLLWLTQPICGVYVQDGKGLRFESNRIKDHGTRPRLGQEPEPGSRGGIHILMATVDTYRAELNGFEGQRGIGLRQDGAPALVVHDNLVVAPQGRALEALAFGPVAITCNQLTTQGNLRMRTAFRPAITGAGFRDTQVRPEPVVIERDLGLERAADFPLENRADATFEDFQNSLGGATVFVINLGLSNEIYAQSFGFSGFSQAARLLDPERPASPTGEERALVGGNLLFNDNQVVLDGFSEGQNLPLSSITLITAADLSVLGNQADSDLPFGELVATQALLIGMSLRVCNNRFTEPVWGAVLSATTFGLMNRTTENQGTHCFLASGLPRISRTSPNEVFLDLFTTGDQSACSWLGSTGVPTPSNRPGDREIIAAQLPASLRVAERMRFYGLDRWQATAEAEHSRAGLAFAASGQSDRLDRARFFQQSGGRLEAARKGVREKETATVAVERDEIQITGRVLGAISSRAVIVLFRSGEFQSPLAQTQAKAGRYDLRVSRQKFVDYFQSAQILSLGVVLAGRLLAVAEQPLGRLDQSPRRLDIVLPDQPVDPKPDPEPDEPKPDEPKPVIPKPDEPKPDEPKPVIPKPALPKPVIPKPADPGPVKADPDPSEGPGKPTGPPKPGKGGRK